MKSRHGFEYAGEGRFPQTPDWAAEKDAISVAEESFITPIGAQPPGCSAAGYRSGGVDCSGINS